MQTSSATTRTIVATRGLANDLSAKRPSRRCEHERYGLCQARRVLDGAVDRLAYNLDLVTEADMARQVVPSCRAR
jgi:hypothetical protein